MVEEKPKVELLLAANNEKAVRIKDENSLKVYGHKILCFIFLFIMFCTTFFSVLAAIWCCLISFLRLICDFRNEGKQRQ